MKKILLLTATISPSTAQGDLKVLSAQARLKEYTAALDHYANQTHLFDLLIFADNSGHDLSALQNTFKHPKFLLMATQGNIAAGEHRGVGELKILQSVMDHLVAHEPGPFVVIKVSGRYQLWNAGTFLPSVAGLKGLMGTLTPTWLELSVLAWHRSAWPALQHAWAQSPPGLAPELHLGQHFTKAHKGLVVPWKKNPFLRGKLGSTGKEINGKHWRLKHIWTEIKNTFKR
jgi:hypothetical protein